MTGVSGNPQRVRARGVPRPLVAVMSSGFFGFFAHAGFLQGLEDLGLVPDAYAGTSSGALVAACAAAGLSPQDMLAAFCRLRRRDFWDPPSGRELLALCLRGWRGESGYLRGRAFRRILEAVLPVHRFEDCRRRCLIVALDAAAGRRVVFTAGPLVPAVVASGAVPLLFRAVSRGEELLLDGGLVDKAPLAAAAEYLQPASMVVHLLPSASLEAPPEHTLARRWAPFRLQARAVDAARAQVYRDQMDRLRSRMPVWEVVSRGLPRLGPRRLSRGPEAFALARRLTVESLRHHARGSRTRDCDKMDLGELSRSQPGPLLGNAPCDNGF